MSRNCLLSLLLCWAVTGNVIRTIDGDTAVFGADIWPGLNATIIVRLIGVDSPERNENKEKWEAARLFTAKWLERGDVLIAGCKLDSFGRFLGVVSREGVTLQSELLRAGHAVKRD